MARFKNIWIQKMFEIALHSETAKLNRKCEHRIKFQPFLFRLIMTFMKDGRSLTCKAALKAAEMSLTVVQKWPSRPNMVIILS